jgi:hypothetical protein
MVSIFSHQISKIINKILIQHFDIQYFVFLYSALFIIFTYLYNFRSKINICRALNCFSKQKLFILDNLFL